MNTAKVISLQSYNRNSQFVNSVAELFISTLVKSDGTFNSTGKDYTRLVKTTFNVSDLVHITEQQIKLFTTQSLINIIKDMNSANKSASAVNLLKCALKKYFDVVMYVQAEQNVEIIRTNPASNTILSAYIKQNTKKGIKTNTKELDFTAPQNILRNIESSNENCFVKMQDMLMIKILRSTGLRVDELIQLKTVDIVKFNQNRLNNSDEVNYLILVNNGKGNKSRIVDISEELYTEIKTFADEHRKNSEYLFLSKNNKPIRSTNTVRNMLARYNSTVDPHDFRRMFATSLIENGVSYPDAASLLGHGSDKTTKVYVNQIVIKNRQINANIVHI